MGRNTEHFPEPVTECLIRDNTQILARLPAWQFTALVNSL